MILEELEVQVPEWKQYRGQDRHLDALLDAIDLGFRVDEKQLLFLMDKVDEKLEGKEKRGL